MGPKRKLKQRDDVSDEQSVKKSKSEQSDDSEEVKDINNDATYKDVLEHLYSQRDAEDRPLWKMFDVLPSQEEFPVYYDFIKDPIDLRTIKKKIQTRQYNSIDELEVDILLVFKNAHAFNEPKSQISKDATQLKKAYLAKRIELNKSVSKSGKRGKTRNATTAESEQSDLDADLKAEDFTLDTLKNKSLDMDTTSSSRSVSSPMESKDDGLIDQNFEHNVFSVLYNLVVGYTDSSGRALSSPFLRQPNRKSNPSYYELIKRPLSLCKIRTKIKASYYSDINILEKDMNCVFENARLYHDADTQICKDAVFLQKFMNEKKCELEKTTQYIEMRELMPKRGRPRGPKIDKGESNEDTPPVNRRKPKLRESVATPETSDPKMQKQRMLSMYNSVLEFKDAEGRSMSAMFLELPDPDEYPDYYKVIPHPIDMERIREKIENSEYSSEDDFVHDFEILFQNARHYNEEGSEIYEDSVILEKTLKKERRYLNRLSDGKKSTPGKRDGSPSLMQKTGTGQGPNRCQELLSHIRGYVDDTGRALAAIFERLPSRNDYPDYYLLIKRPIDLTYIAGRCHKYATVDEMEHDLLLLFNNACTYNEPDSQIYKDALTLLRIMNQKKNEIIPDSEDILPDVALLVQGLMQKLFSNVMEHRDEEGRCYSDSLLEVTVTAAEGQENEANKRKPISLPIINQLLKLGFYKRLDTLQDDIFAVLRKARKSGDTDSEIYEDACELLSYFIIERDFLTKDGVRMISPALCINGRSVQQEIDHERKEKILSESKHKTEVDEDNKPKGRFRGAIIFEVTPEESQLDYIGNVTQGDITYKLGDFVYVKPEDPTRPPNIMSVDKIWIQKDGLQGLYGCWYYRPEATYHLASRKFMEREVFRSHQNTHVMLQGVIGKCLVMNVKDYIKNKPENFKEEDVYVCESRYNANTKSFRKIKTYFPPSSNVTTVARETPLQVKRVSSIFAASASAQQQDGGKKESPLETKKEELTSTIGYEVPLTKSLEIEVPNAEEGCTYFEKFRIDNDIIKIGDSVYVKSDEDYLMIARILKIWKDSNGKAFFHGNWFVLPEDTKHLPTQFFMEQECFESNLEDSAEISQIVGKCAILNQRDYLLTRPTELPEKDVFVCTAYYNEEELKFRKNIKGFKKLGVTEQIRDDEYWIFDRPYQPKRRPSRWLTDSVINGVPNESAEKEKEKLKESGTEGEEEMDEKDEKEENVKDDKEKEKNELQDDIGYTLMKKEFAANLMKENPEIPINEIAKKTEEHWNTLTEEEKIEFKGRAKKQGLDERILVFQCYWDTCTYQFEDLQDLMVHVMEGSHLGEGSSFHNCLWRNCHRREKKAKPFLTHSRLVRHIREVHFKNPGTKILTSQKSKFYFPRHQTCEEMYKSSENSDRPSSRGSSTPSLGSPSGLLKNDRTPMSPGIMPNMSNSPMYQNPMQMQAGMFPPYRMNGPPTPQALMQQQILQQQMMMQNRGQMMNNAHLNMPRSSMSLGNMSHNSMSLGNMTPGNMPPMSSGHMPPGNMPPGNMPPGSMPPGSMTPGNMPPGNMPPGSMPSVSIPPGTMPPGSISSGNMSPGHITRPRPNIPNSMHGSMPNGLPNGMPNGPGGIPNVMLNRMPNGMSNGPPGGMPNGPGGMPNGPSGMPNVSTGMPNGPGEIHNGVPSSMSNGIPNQMQNGAMPNNAHTGTPNGPGGMPNGPRGMPNGHPSSMPNGMPNGMPPRHPMAPHSSHSQHPPQQGPMLSVDQQQMLISQVQRQQQQIQRLQQQVQQFVVQQQQKQALEEQKKKEEETPIFVTPPTSSQKLRHSEAYLRYIEGLRDNKSSLSSWSEMSDGPRPKTPTGQLPTDWIGDKSNHGYDSVGEAFMALRDHMLRDAVSI